MWGGFAKVIAEVLATAQIVTDRFHVMKPLIEELRRIARQLRIKGVEQLALLLLNQDNLNPKQVEDLENLPCGQASCVKLISIKKSSGKFIKPGKL